MPVVLQLFHALCKQGCPDSPDHRSVPMNVAAQQSVLLHLPSICQLPLEAPQTTLNHGSGITL